MLKVQAVAVWDEVKQGMQCLVGGEPSFSFPAVREQAAAFSARAFHWGKTSCGHSTMAILALSGAGSACTMFGPVD